MVASFRTFDARSKWKYLQGAKLLVRPVFSNPSRMAWERIFQKRRRKHEDIYEPKWNISQWPCINTYLGRISDMLSRWSITKTKHWYSVILFRLLYWWTWAKSWQTHRNLLYIEINIYMCNTFNQKVKLIILIIQPFFFLCQVFSLNFCLYWRLMRQTEMCHGF